jgi:hypothetical protein
MRLRSGIIALLRVLLVVLFAGLFGLQVFSLPGMFAYRAGQQPELGALPWALLAFSVVELLCLQVVIVCIWRLLRLVQADRIFTPKAFRWVDGIVAAMATGWVLVCILFAAAIATIFVTPELRDPGTPILLSAIALVGGVVVLTVVVLRSLLHQAAALRADLDEVI